MFLSLLNYHEIKMYNCHYSLPRREEESKRTLYYADPIPPLCVHSLTF